MRKLLMILTLSAIAVAAALPGYANGVVLQGADSAQTPQTDDAARNKMYEDFLNARKKWKDDVGAKAPTADASYKAAYDIAKEYTDKYGAANDDYAKYVKKFVTDYDTYHKSLRAPRIEQLVKDKKFPEAYALGKEVLNEEPNNLAVLYLLSSAALQAEGDTYNAEGNNYAKRALQLIEQGK